MAAKYQAPRGTYDLLPEQAAVRARILGEAKVLVEGAGFGQIDTPIFEDTELFVRTVGEATDIVRKEMYTFTDQGGRSLTLRPEGTAPVCRAYLEHGMHKLPQPVKLWYTGPMFRYERAQAGRYRQHAQIGAEAIGSDDPAVDAELIDVLAHLYARLRPPGVRLHLTSIGDARIARRVRARAARRPARPRRVRRRAAGADRDQPDAGVRLGRSGDRRGHERRAEDGGPPLAGGRGALRGGAPPARRRGDRLPAGPAAGARARLLHAHGLRVPLRRAGCAERDRRRRPLRPPDRAARRAADARGGLGDRARTHRAGARVDGERVSRGPGGRSRAAPTSSSS